MADFDRVIAGPTSTILGVFDGDGLVASVTVGHDGNRGCVYSLSVLPARRGEGLGARAMADAETWLRSRGISKLNLMVRAGNSDATAFHERLGYEASDVMVFGRFLT